MRISRGLLYCFLFLFFFSFNFYFRPVKGNSLVTKQYKKSKSYVNNLYASDEHFKEGILSEDEYEMYYAIIDASIKDKSYVSIPCTSDCSRFSSAINAVVLDHPELISFQLIGSYKILDDHVEYWNNENLSAIKTYLGTRRIEREMENIRRDTKGMSDKEKILYVYNYVASHNYDRGFTWSSSNQSAYSFFTKGTSVCAGFAKASQIIFQNIGIKSYLVEDSDHMWNYVEYKGKYYIFDSTVGTSFSDKKNQNYYDGLGRTTVGVETGLYEELYPEIESDHLRDMFGI